MEVEVIRTARSRGPARPPAGAAGFSLIEVAIAAVLLLVITLALVPLFGRSMVSNVHGHEYTKVSNFAKSRAEEYLQLPLDSPALAVPGGTTEQVVVERYSRDQHRFVDALPAGDVSLYTRTTTVRQYNVADLETPLDGGAPPGTVHLKEIVVEVERDRDEEGLFSSGKDIVLKVYKSQ